MSDIKLKPCPFCGGKCEIERMGTGRVSMQYQCGECGCSLETGETWLDDDCRWNERHNDTLTAKVAELKTVLFNIKYALAANPNESSEALFDKCANAFKIAEYAQKALEAES